MEKKETRGGFSSSLGFILAAAGSAIGLGNLWRFPYLAAKDGGGLFIVIYILFSLTFGFALMTTEIAIGRKTGLSPFQAYGKVDKRFKFIGVLATLVPVLIFPYYCVIGGWVTKYAFTYATGGASQIREVGPNQFFGNFITAQASPMIWFLVFMILTAVVVILGVDKGIEKASKIMMPILAVLIIGISVYSLTLKHTDENGVTRTALEGLKIYLIPNLDGITPSKFITVALDAMGQMFYSMSLAMGIMITYGSYCRKDSNLISSVNQIEIFDTAVALFAGLIMIPTVYAFQGREGLSQAGPGLMFKALPAIFEEMGKLGEVVGACFFLLVLFAALTSSISLMETVASVFIDRFKMSRPKATGVTFICSVLIGVTVCLGYNVWYFEATLPNGATGQQILDILDYISNSILMPIVAILTCVLIGWVAKPEYVVDEVKQGIGNKKFRREKLYVVMMKFIAPVLLFLIFLQAFNVFSFLK